MLLVIYSGVEQLDNLVVLLVVFVLFCSWGMSTLTSIVGGLIFISTNSDVGSFTLVFLPEVVVFPWWLGCWPFCSSIPWPSVLLENLSAYFTAFTDWMTWFFSVRLFFTHPSSAAPVWHVKLAHPSHSKAVSSHCWPLPLLCRGIWISCNPAFQLFELFPVLLESCLFLFEATVKRIFFYFLAFWKYFCMLFVPGYFAQSMCNRHLRSQSCVVMSLRSFKYNIMLSE